MGTKDDQTQLRQVLRDTIKLLCKNALQYNQEFSVEGLLGITVDNQDIFLVNINELLVKPPPVQTEDPVVISEHEPSSTVTSTSSPVSYYHHGRNSFGRRTLGFPFTGGHRRKRKRVTDILRGINNHLESSRQGDHERESSFSRTDVRSEINHSAFRQSESSDPAFEARSGAVGTSGEQALQRLADCIGRIDNSRVVRRSVEKEAAEESLSCGARRVKQEQSDSEPDVATDDTVAYDEQHLPIHREEDLEHDDGARDENATSMSWFAPPKTEDQAVVAAFSRESLAYAVVSGGPVSSPLMHYASPQLPSFGHSLTDSAEGSRRGRSLGVEERDPSKEAECEHSAVWTPGCIVIPRILCRAKGFKVGNVMNAMKAMTRRRDDPLYVGEYKQISGSMKTFYKCPPDLIKDEALAKYNLTRDAYSLLFYRNPRPKLGGPVNWANYVEILLRHTPLGSQYFPLDSMGLAEAELSNIYARMSQTRRLDNQDYYSCTGETGPNEQT